MLDARRVAQLLGGVVIGRDRVIAPGPGHSRKDKSLSVLLDPTAPDGFIVHSFAGNDWRNCRTYILQRLGLPAWQPGSRQDCRRLDIDAVNAKVDEPRWRSDEIKRINLARALWREAKDPRGTLAAIYLKQHRRLDLGDGLAGNVLRFHAECPWRDEDAGQTITVPALLAAFRQIDNNTITAVQRIRLNADGSKINRRMLGVVHNAAVKLAMPDNGALSVGEGIETCLAAMHLGFKPTWAMGSCNSISGLPVIENVTHLTLLGENDTASASAVKACSDRWLQAGRSVRVVMPDAGHGDLNDELMTRVE